MFFKKGHFKPLATSGGGGVGGGVRGVGFIQPLGTTLSHGKPH